MPKKFKTKGSPEVHEELKGFEIKINEFGELESNLQIDKINDFLNKHRDKHNDIDKKDKKATE